MGLLALLVLLFARSAMGEHALLDGQGVAMWVELVLERIREGGGVGTWFGEMWGGTPAFQLAPSFAILWLVPLGAWLGPDAAVGVASVLAQLVGALGAFVLAKALFGRPWAAFVAGAVYGLHPIVISHLFLFGHEPAGWVMAAMPWFALFLRSGLRTGDRRAIVGAGLVGGFAVLQQAQNAYALVLLAAFLVLLELFRSGRPGVRAVPSAVLVRAVAVAALTAGLAAVWLAPFIASRGEFIANPEDVVQATLSEGLAGEIANHPEVFVQRSGGVNGTQSLDLDTVLLPGNFYIGWVALGLTVIAIALLPRFERDGTLTAILLASALGLWLSSAAVPLARSESVSEQAVIPLALLGAVIGVLVGTFLIRMGIGRGASVALAVGGALLGAIPYLAPFLFLRRLLPFLDIVRWPRFYTLAVLGVALAAGFCVAQLGRAAAGSGKSALLTAGAAIAVVGLLAVDVAPYRSFYEAEPDTDVARSVAAAAQRVSELAPAGRVATPDFADPLYLRPLLEHGLEPAVGWPHAIADTEAFFLAGRSWLSPGAYRLRALGLFGVRYLVTDVGGGGGETEGEVVAGLAVLPNRWVKPAVRAYRRAFVVNDDHLAAVLAPSVSGRGWATVSGTVEDVAALGRIEPSAGLDDEDEIRSMRAAMSGEVAFGLAASRWLGRSLEPTVEVSDGTTAGGVFAAELPDLSGIAVHLQGDRSGVELALHEVDGETVGDRVAVAEAAPADPYGLYRFVFDPPIPDTVGRRFAFLLSCDDCEDPPSLSTVFTEDDGDLVVDGSLEADRAVAFAPIHEALEDVPAADARISYERTQRGAWDVRIDAVEPSLVVVAETHFDGWAAEVDGHPAPLMRADGAFLGVPVDPGSHEISLRFTPPWPLVAGRAISMLTLLVSLVVLVVGRRRRPRPPVRTATPRRARASLEAVGS